jgi:hypothetical protein
MKDRIEKGLMGRRPPLQSVERPAVPRTRSAVPVVADASTPAWKTYCASRLRQFASGR